MKKTLICLLFPFSVFSNEDPLTNSSRHKFYAQPEVIMGEELIGPAVALGYRYRKTKIGVDIGFDAGFHLFPISMCGSWGVIPIPKASIIVYPTQKSFYFGAGLHWLAPCGTIGYEIISKDSAVLFYTQLDVLYLESPYGIFSLGLGF